MNILTPKNHQDLTMFLTRLKGGYKVHANQLLKGIDPTGGLVSLDDQLQALHVQFLNGGK